MSVRLSLLALLDQGPCYGYQLRAELDWRTGGAGPVNVGQIYNTLDRLERDKLVRKTGDQNYYEITPAGSDEVRAWFANPSPAADLAAKLALAVTLPGVDVPAIIRAQRAALPAALVRPTAVANNQQPANTEQLAAAVRNAGGMSTAEAERQLLDEVGRLYAAAIPTRPLSSDVPKRGRPARIVP